MVTRNFTRQPTLFGCDAAEGTPLVLYLPNSPWSGYTNFSYMKTSFTDNELDLTLENGFQLATYGNGTRDENWPACLACAAIKGSLTRVGIETPRQCKECFEKHCWDGKESTEKATAEGFDLSLRLNSSLTYQEWNDTVWSTGAEKKDSSKPPKNSAASLGKGERLSGRFFCIAIMLLGVMLL
jgi:lysophospholipase